MPKESNRVIFPHSRRSMRPWPLFGRFRTRPTAWRWNTWAPTSLDGLLACPVVRPSGRMATSATAWLHYDTRLNGSPLVRLIYDARDMDDYGAMPALRTAIASVWQVPGPPEVMPKESNRVIFPTEGWTNSLEVASSSINATALLVPMNTPR